MSLNTELSLEDGVLENEMLNFIANREHDLKFINLPKSSEFVMNSRNQKLHVRSYLPDESIKALVIFIHGYTGHVNRPMYSILGREFCKNNYGFITFDLHGHGYSEGLKVYINDCNDVIDDISSVLNALYMEKDQTTEENGDVRFHLKKSNFQCPFVLVGQSLGGGANILCSHEIFSQTIDSSFSSKLSKFYLGSVLVCPAIYAPLPSEVVSFVLEYFVVPLFPTFCAPSFLTNTNNSSLAWKSESLEMYMRSDGDKNNPDGLGWSLPVRFRTGYSMIKLISKVQAVLPEVTFPFIVLHDPDDQVVLIRGTLELMEKSATSSTEKKFIPVANGLHDLFHNKSSFLFNNICDFVESKLSKWSVP